MPRMPHRSALAAIAAVVLTTVAVASASAAATSKPPVVHVQQPLSVKQDVVISFRPPSALPTGGYYYAVLVLENYRPPTPGVPQCAISSDMQLTRYGYPHRGQVRLVLSATKSPDSEWCPQGQYAGAIYEVPHKPRYGTTAQCFGGNVCGIIALPPPYSYPGGLPKPRDKSARLVEPLHVQFGAT
jgi:hypothetical protein